MLDDFFRRVNGKFGVLIVNDLTKDLDDQDQDIAELAKIWSKGESTASSILRIVDQTGEYKSKLNGRTYDLAE